MGAIMAQAAVPQSVSSTFQGGASAHRTGADYTENAPGHQKRDSAARISAEVQCTGALGGSVGEHERTQPSKFRGKYKFLFPHSNQP